MFDIISRDIQSFFKSLFDNVLDLIGQQSLYVLSTAWARESIAVVQLSDPVIWFKLRQSRDRRRLVMVESLIRRYFIFMFCRQNFFVNMFRFRINNGRWSDISEMRIPRIPETNSFGWFMKILSIKVAVWLVIRDSLVIIGMSDWEVRELRRFNEFLLSYFKISRLIRAVNSN